MVDLFTPTRLPSSGMEMLISFRRSLMRCPTCFGVKAMSLSISSEGLKKSLMRYAIESGAIIEKVYRREMETPVEDMKRFMDGLLHIYDEGRTKMKIGDLLDMSSEARERLNGHWTNAGPINPMGLTISEAMAAALPPCPSWCPCTRFPPSSPPRPLYLDRHPPPSESRWCGCRSRGCSCPAEDSLIFGGLTSSGSADQPILNDNASIVQNTNDIAFAVNQILGEGITDAEARIAQDFAATGGDNYEVVNPYASDMSSNTNSFIAQYCAPIVVPPYSVYWNIPSPRNRLRFWA